MRVNTPILQDGKAGQAKLDHFFRFAALCRASIIHRPSSIAHHSSHLHPTATRDANLEHLVIPSRCNSSSPRSVPSLPHPEPWALQSSIRLDSRSTVACVVMHSLTLALLDAVLDNTTTALACARPTAESPFPLETVERRRHRHRHREPPESHRCGGNPRRGIANAPSGSIGTPDTTLCGGLDATGQSIL